MNLSILRTLLLWMCFLLLPVSLSAQELKVKSMELLADATAMDFNYQMQDLNGDYAGIVKVLLAVSGAEFEGGGVLKHKQHRIGEYWVWMAKDSKRLRVHAPGFLPLDVNFHEAYSIKIESKRTYQLVLTKPEGGTSGQDDNKGFLSFTIEPRSATLSIDGKDVALVDGQYSRLVDSGTYNYEVTAQGYTSQRGTVFVDAETPTKNIRLESTLSTLQVTCATLGAQIYLDGRLRGTAPQTITLSPEPHRIEARLDGYRSYREDITLREKENRRLDIPALAPLTGSIRVNYMPLGSDVYVDGVKVGTNPGTFRNVAVGDRKVEIRKDGYVTEIKTVSVNEDAITDLSGSLTASATPVQNTANQNGNVVSQVTSTFGNIKTFTANGVSFNMVRVEGGTFRMGATDGDSDEKPVHDVTLGDYMIGETEVTQELWEAVMGTTVRQQRDKANKDWSIRGEGKNYPMYYISWEECKEFIEKLNILTGQRFRFPTEAEWEYAARGGRKSVKAKYSGSNTLDEVAWYWQNSGDKFLNGTDSDWSADKVNQNNCETHPVKSKKANELGIYDMSGNVLEWCADWYDSDYYTNSPSSNPKGPDKRSRRVSRGGGWHGLAGVCRVSNRNSSTPGGRGGYLGFRLAL